MTRRIGQLVVPTVGVGCNSFGMWADEEASIAVVATALDAGASFFDTADYYGSGTSEEILGKALRGRRDEAIVATKFGIMGRKPPHGRADAAFVRKSLTASLRRLDTDHIDLYQLHFPDADTPAEETLGTLAALVDEGLIREAGICNVTPGLIDEWTSAGTDGVRIASVQNEWSLLRRRVEAEVVPACRNHGLAVIPYFPLAAGLLTGKYDRTSPPAPDTRFAKAPFLAERYHTDAAMAVVEQLTAFAAERERTLLELALSWLAGRAEVATVISGASRPAQVHANVAAATWELTPAERAAIDQITARPD